MGQFTSLKKSNKKEKNFLEWLSITRPYTIRNLISSNSKSFSISVFCKCSRKISLKKVLAYFQKTIILETQIESAHAAEKEYKPASRWCWGLHIKPLQARCGPSKPKERPEGRVSAWKRS